MAWRRARAPAAPRHHVTVHVIRAYQSISCPERSTCWSCESVLCFRVATHDTRARVHTLCTHSSRLRAQRTERATDRLVRVECVPLRHDMRTLECGRRRRRLHVRHTLCHTSPVLQHAYSYRCCTYKYQSGGGDGGASSGAGGKSSFVTSPSAIVRSTASCSPPRILPALTSSSSSSGSSPRAPKNCSWTAHRSASSSLSYAPKKFGVPPDDGSGGGGGRSSHITTGHGPWHGATRQAAVGR